ncbi:MAG: hypothetical protein JSS61_05835 [Verrucomicrobia bacterium]|nr:hypothetical protein [Verrucomicrobiota bacterium]
MFSLQAAHCKQLSDLSLDQKIGQLFIIPACPLGGEAHFIALEALLRDHHIGGVLFKQGTSQDQLALISRLAKAASIPLLHVQDAEWGVGMRLTDVPPLPKNRELGKQDDLYEIGQEIGRQCRAVGAHLCLGPVVDVDSNPDNPIIGARSFSQDPEVVARCGNRVIQGIQSTGILACAKHFPGHGDAAVDSHVALPQIHRSKEELEQLELIPFKGAIESGVAAIMSGHLYVPALAEEPATFSRAIITDLLQETLRFHGLILTDALNMNALTREHSPGEIALRAFQAGHDLLLYGDHLSDAVEHILSVQVPEAIRALKEGFLSGQLSVEDLDKRVEKILNSKSCNISERVDGR